jgi:hypothetical protein
MALSNVCPGPVELSPERSSPSPAPSQGPSTHITHPLSGGYRDSDQEIRDLQITHATRSEMAAGELLDRESLEHQAEEYLQGIEDNVMERMEVALLGASDDERRLNESALIQLLYEEPLPGADW